MEKSSPMMCMHKEHYNQSAWDEQVRTLDIYILTRGKMGSCQHGAHGQQCILCDLEICQFPLDGHACPLKVPQLPARLLSSYSSYLATSMVVFSKRPSAFAIMPCRVLCQCVIDLSGKSVPLVYLLWPF